MVDTTKPLHIESDASEYATGAVLSMLQDDGKWHPCAYLSKEFNDTERNYDVHDKEMMSIMRALEAWQHYVGIRLRSGQIIITWNILCQLKS